MTPKYHFICDPGHGWLEVKLAELEELGIENKISAYSYKSLSFPTKVYLEEDCDMSIFMDASGITRDDMTRIYFDDECFVRYMPNYMGSK